MRRRAVVLYLLKGAYAALTFTLGVVVARLWGVGAFADFALLWTVLVVGLIIGNCGTSYYLIELLPTLTSRQYGFLLRRLSHVTLVGGATASLLGGVVLVLLGSYWMSAVAIIPGSLHAMYSGGLVAEGRQVTAGVLDGVVRPAVTLGAVVALGVTGFGPGPSLATALLVSYGAAAALGFALTRTPAAAPGALQAPPLGRMLGPLSVFVAMGVLTTLLAQADRFVIDAFGDPEQLASYAAAQNVTNAVIYAVNSVAVLVLPQIASVMAGRQSPADMQRGFDQVCRPLVALSLVAAVGASLFGDQVLAVFGPAFVEGQWAMVVLFLGMAAALTFGFPLSVLSMSDDRRYLPVHLLGGVAVLLLLAYVLLPVAGSVGVAVANAVAGVAVRVSIDVQCRCRGLPTYWILRLPERVTRAPDHDDVHSPSR